MIIVLKPEADAAVVAELMGAIEARGLKPLHLPGTERVVLGAIGDERVLAQLHLDGHPMVEDVRPVLAPYKLVSRELRPDDSVVRLGATAVGGDAFVVITGPCAVESAEQMSAAARAARDAGAGALRGGAFKPRTSPYSFQGLGPEGLHLLRAAGDEVGLPVVTEVVETADVALVAEHADALQVGARNMQNFRLLREVGRCHKPVVLKRGMSATVEDLLLAAEYILSEGNEQVILCERGIRTFETATRNTLDLSAVPLLKQRSHLPVVVDPSHAAGRRDLVAPLSLAALAVGADGLLVEMHPDPAHALSDGAQSLFPDQLSALMSQLRAVGEALGRPVGGAPQRAVA
jgi:3-deoxy-7-phosphoheptulonate synthase